MTKKERLESLNKIASDMILEKASDKEIRAELEKAGANAFELSSVPREAERLIYRTLRREISGLLQEGSTEEEIAVLIKKRNFPASSEVESLISEEIKELIKQKLYKITPLIKQGFPLSDLIKYADRFVSEDEIRTHYENTKKNLAKAEHEEKKSNIMTGWVLVGAGIVLSMISYAFAAPGQSYFLFTGLIVYGVIQMLRGAAEGGS